MLNVDPIWFIEIKKRKKKPFLIFNLVSVESIKGLVHPKMKIMLFITHPHVIPNL